MSSNRKNNKNKKDDVLNSYAMEALEPRLMMAADLGAALEEFSTNDLSAALNSSLASTFSPLDENALSNHTSSVVDFSDSKYTKLSSFFSEVTEKSSTQSKTLSTAISERFNSISTTATNAANSLADIASAINSNYENISATVDNNSLALLFDFEHEALLANVLKLSSNSIHFDIDADLSTSFSLALSLDLVTTSTEDNIDYNFAFRSISLDHASVSLKVDELGANLSYMNLSFTEQAIDSNPDFNLSFNIDSSKTITPDFSVDFEFSLDPNNSDSLVSFAAGEYLKITHKEGELDISLPNLSLNGEGLDFNSILKDIADIPIPFLTKTSLSALPFFNGANSKISVSNLATTLNNSAASLSMALNAAIEGKTINLTQASMNNLLKQLNLSSLFSPEISLKSSVGGELEYELRLVHEFSNLGGDFDAPLSNDFFIAA